MKYQIRISEVMNDRPASEVLNTYSEAVKKLDEVKTDILNTWATPDPEVAYIYAIFDGKGV